MEIDFVLSALVLGFLSGFHCIGMCGPIALSMGITRMQRANYYAQNVMYQLGRISTYAVLGFFLGFLGEGMQIAGFQKYLTMAAGLFLIVMAISSLGKKSIVFKVPFFSSGLLKLKLFLGRFLRKSDYKSRYLTGVLNGLLPCGVVYVALAASLASGGVWKGALFMVFFGLGTFPFMFLVVLTGNMFTRSLKINVAKIFPVLMIVLGGLFIVRGMELGIPYLSPPSGAMKIVKERCKGQEHSCCH